MLFYIQSPTLTFDSRPLSGQNPVILSKWLQRRRRLVIYCSSPPTTNSAHLSLTIYEILRLLLPGKWRSIKAWSKINLQFFDKISSTWMTVFPKKTDRFFLQLFLSNRLLTDWVVISWLLAEICQKTGEICQKTGKTFLSHPRGSLLHGSSNEK